MITVEKSGKIYIPPKEGFIGYAGDNLNKTIEFQLKERNDPEIFYRIYLKFDDDTVNFFILNKKIEGENTVISWNITEDQIYKSGIVYLQIKGFDTSGEKFHTECVPLIVGDSIEFGNYFAKNQISEFLEGEKALNQLYSDIENAKEFLPYIGGNGNWFVYDYQKKAFIDSNVTAKGIVEDAEFLLTQIGNLSYLNTEDKTSLVNAVNEVQENLQLKLDDADSVIKNNHISDGAVREEKLSYGAVTTNKLATNSVTSVKIANGAVDTGQIANKAITSNKIADNAISNISQISSALIDSEPIQYSTNLISSGSVYNVEQQLKEKENLSNKCDTYPADGKYVNTQDRYPSIQYLLHYYYEWEELYTKAESNERFVPNIAVGFDENGVAVRTKDVGNYVDIGDFTSNTKIKKVFLPSKVTGIHIAAFTGCTNLEEIIIDNVQRDVWFGYPPIPAGVKAVYTDAFNAATEFAKGIEYLNNNKYDKSNIETGTGTMTLPDEYAKSFSTVNFNYQKMGDYVIVNFDFRTTGAIAATNGVVSFYMDGLPFLCKKSTIQYFRSTNSTEMIIRINDDSSQLQFVSYDTIGVNSRMAPTLIYQIKE